MKQSEGCQVMLCKGYPFNDNSNVFDYSMNNHKITEFVKQYEEYQSDTADIDIANGVVTIRIGENNDMTFNNNKYGHSFAKIQQCNYMTVTMLNNGMKYYCFINNVVLNNNLLTATIHFSIDVWNTYRNKITFKNCFIEREHVEDDTKYKHVIDEGLSPSQYYVNTSITQQTQSLQNYGYVVGLSDATYVMIHHDTTSFAKCVYEMSQNVFAGLLVHVPDDATLIRLISVYTTFGKADAITGVYLLPNNIITNKIATPAELRYYTPDDVDQENPIYYPVTINTESSSALTPSSLSVSAPSTCTVKGVSYTPVNNKCFCYPYAVCRVTNHLGNELNLHFEKSQNANNTITISYVYEANINGCCFISVSNYDGISGINCDYVIKTMDYPTVPYTVNSFDAWYGANRNMLSNQQVYIDKDYAFNMAVARAETTMQETSNAMSSALGVLGGDINAGAGVMGLANYAMKQQSLYNTSVIKKNTLDYNYNKALSSFNASLADKALIPQKICGMNAPNALLLFGKNEFVITVLCPSIEEIRAIDNYFSKYGYKVNRYDTLAYYRPRFDFKKYADCNIVGDCPSDVINTIRGMFQQGVTIWHDKDNIFTYNNNKTNSPTPQPPQPR